MAAQTTDRKYDITPHDGTPGRQFEDFLESMMNALAGELGDDGYSVADHLLGNDPGGANGPAHPIGAAGTKSQALARKRSKKAYAFITGHITNKDLVTSISKNHMHDGLGAYNYIKSVCSPTISKSQLRDMNDEWNKLDLLEVAGVQEHSITLLGTKIRVLNGRRPQANQFSSTECTEKLLECIMQTSKHFAEGATEEYEAAAGSRKFELAPVAPALTGERDFEACVASYHQKWSTAVRTRVLGLASAGSARLSPTRTSRPTSSTR